VHQSQPAREIADEATKTLFTPVLNTLDWVDGLLADARDDRTPERKASWLGWAERWLQFAGKELDAVTELVQKYGGPKKVRTIK